MLKYCKECTEECTIRNLAGCCEAI
jgi:hypothetical protein